MTSKESEYLDRLSKRADWLAARIAEAEAMGKEYTYDRSELSALRWAIGKLELYLETQDDHRGIDSLPEQA